MSDTVTVALISTSGSLLVAITALILNFRLFSAIGERIGSLERRLELIEQDIKEWHRIFARLDTDVQRLKDHTGLK